jgi:hypothetical protein
MRSFPTFFIGNPSLVFSPKPLVSDTGRMYFPSYNRVFGVAGFRPGSRGPFLSGKGPKTIDAQFGHIGWDGRKMRRADQLAALKQGPPVDKSVRPRGRTAGVGNGGKWITS